MVCSIKGVKFSEVAYMETPNETLAFAFSLKTFAFLLETLHFALTHKTVDFPEKLGKHNAMKAFK